MSSLERTELTVVGEVQGAPLSTEYGYAKFDIAEYSDDSVSLLNVFLGGRDFHNVSRYLRHASGGIDAVLQNGAVVHVQGTLAPSRTGAMQLRAQRIALDPTKTGRFERNQRETFRRLEKAYPGRFPRASTHERSREAWGLYNHFEDRDIARITVLAAEQSEVLEEFEKVISRIRRDIRPSLEIVRVSFGANAGESLAKAVRAVDTLSSDLIAIIRGGGRWHDFIPFGSEALARAILESEVPVATAIGHGADHSVADMAADVSFLTPTSLAESIATQRRMANRKDREDDHSVTRTERLARELELEKAESEQLRRSAAESDQLMEQVVSRYMTDLRSFGLMRICVRARLLGALWSATSGICLTLSALLLDGWPPSVVVHLLGALGLASFPVAVFAVRGRQRALHGHISKRNHNVLTDQEWWEHARLVRAPRHYKQVFRA